MISEKRLYEWIGRSIKEARSQLDMTQERLAALVDLERTSITNIEGGKQRIPIHVLYGIASAVRKDVNQLIPPPAEVQRLEAEQVEVRVGGNEQLVPPSVAEALRRLEFIGR